MFTYQSSRKACYLGSIIQAITVNVPPVLFIIFQDTYRIRYAQLGTLILLTFVIQIIVDLILAKTARYCKPRALLIGAGVCTFAGYGLLALVPNWLPSHIFEGLLGAALIYSMGSGMLEVMVSPVVAALPNEDQGSSMAFLHSFYCWGQLGSVLITTLLLWIIGRDHWQWILAFWMLFPAVDILLFMKVPMPPMETGENAGGMKQLLNKKLFWAAMMIMIAAGASELAMSQWASLFAQKGLNVGKTLGDVAGPCFFALMMGCGRVFYGLKGERLKMGRALMLSALLCIGSYLLTVLSPWPALSLLGCGLCGLAVSLMWPGTLVMASQAVPVGGTALFALLALGGDVGCSLGPWLTGLISDGLQTAGWKQSFQLTADQLALRGGLLAAVIFPILLLIFVPILTRSLRQHSLSMQPSGSQIGSERKENQ